MNSIDIQNKDGKYIANTYKRFLVTLTEGCGAIAKDPEGKEYIDFTSGIGVNCLGYADKGWADAVSEQAHNESVQYTAGCRGSREAVRVHRVFKSILWQLRRRGE